MKDARARFLQCNVQWDQTGNAEFPYQATVDGKTWVIRVNDFPEEALYTLIVDNEEISDFSNWPENWLR